MMNMMELFYTIFQIIVIIEGIAFFIVLIFLNKIVAFLDKREEEKRRKEWKYYRWINFFAPEEEREKLNKSRRYRRKFKKSL
jgi:hypothetical protein